MTKSFLLSNHLFFIKLYIVKWLRKMNFNFGSQVLVLKAKGSSPLSINLITVVNLSSAAFLAAKNLPSLGGGENLSVDE